MYPNPILADDLAVWSASENTASSAHRIQEAANKAQQWTGSHISEVKTPATDFSRFTSKGKDAIKFGDSHLSLGKAWHPPVMEAAQRGLEAKGIKKFAVSKRLSGTHWAATPRLLKIVYTGVVRPCMEYGASAWVTAAKTHTNELDRAQNIGWRTSLVPRKPLPYLKWRTKDKPNLSSMQKR